MSAWIIPFAQVSRPTPDVVYGKPLFEYFRDNPKDAANFNQAMTSLSMVESPAVVAAYDFSGIGSIVDVAGGHGMLLSAILSRYPQMKGTLYDRPDVIEGAKSGPLASVMDRCTLSSGDMFFFCSRGRRRRALDRAARRGSESQEA